MATKKVTKEEKLEQIEEAKRCYEEARKLIEQGDALIAKYMRGVKVCRDDEFAPIIYRPHKGMMHIHLYSGIGKLEKLFGVKAEPYINLCGKKANDRKMICIGGIEFMQIGEATQSRFCYK